MARATDVLPAATALPGGSSYLLKFDGFRLVITRGVAGVRLWSRRGTNLTDSFPEVAAAARAQLPLGSVVDGEVCCWNGSRLDFDLLTRRLGGGRGRIARMVQESPASFVAFDILAARGVDLRRRPWRVRQDVLQQLAPWQPPLQLCPSTTDADEARTWMSRYAPAGIEGLVVKGLDSLYRGGSRDDWSKIRIRETQDVVVGAVVGPLHRPTAVVAGRYRDGRLVLVGRTGILTTTQARSLADRLEAADGTHPWPDHIAANRFGSSGRTAITPVAPTVVIEVDADVALSAGAWRHNLRYHRIRPDLAPSDLPPAPG